MGKIELNMDNRTKLNRDGVLKLKTINARKAGNAITKLMIRNATKADREAVLLRHDAIGKALDNLIKELNTTEVLKLELTQKYEN